MLPPAFSQFPAFPPRPSQHRSSFGLPFGPCGPEGGPEGGPSGASASSDRRATYGDQGRVALVG